MSLFLFLLVVALALVLIGLIAKGLVVLLVLGIIVAIGDLVMVGFRSGRRTRRPVR